MKAAYKAGFEAASNNANLSSNPYSKVTCAVSFYAWCGGFNDCKMGYTLDLSVFDYVSDRY